MPKKKKKYKKKVLSTTKFNYQQSYMYDIKLNALYFESKKYIDLFRGKYPYI